MSGSLPVEIVGRSRRRHDLLELIDRLKPTIQEMTAGWKEKPRR
jgi:hypothetical protein